MGQQYPPDPQYPINDEPTQVNQPPQYRRPVNNYSRSVNNGGAYSQSQQQSYVDPTGNRVESREEVYEDRNVSRANARYWITTVTYFILGVLEVIMGLRLLFRLLGANQDNGFITFLYNLSHVFVGAFNGIFNDQAIGTQHVFETSTVIAMLIYALIAWGIVSLGRVIFAPVASGQQSITTTRRGRY
jgi:hypothetical protein